MLHFNDNRPIGQRAKRVVSLKKWRGSDLEQVIEYHDSLEEAVDFILNNPHQPKDGEFEWLVGEYR